MHRLNTLAKDSTKLDETHNPRLRSWVESANEPGTDFPIQNLPLGVFRRKGEAGSGRVGVAIGTEILDLQRALDRDLLDDPSDRLWEALRAPELNPLMALGNPAAVELRRMVSRLLSARAPRPAYASELLVPSAEAVLSLPASVGDFSDFYASLHHATNVGRLFRPDNPILPNYKHVPIAYHGRSSSVVVGGTPVRRPQGQRVASGAAAPRFEHTQSLDYEVELGFWVGTANSMGEPVPIDTAEEHVFGFSLVNDWSARDIQAWEYQPLGPFLSKSFATSVSPWVVTRQALEPFRCPAATRVDGDPEPLPYLASELNAARGGFDITLEAYLETEGMRRAELPPERLSRSSSRHLYWTIAQMLTHHTSNGTSLESGDLIASGTVSGPEADSRGCLLEITRRGQDVLELSSGESRSFLEDGDEVILRAYCDKPGQARIGFGECRGRVLPSRED